MNDYPWIPAQLSQHQRNTTASAIERMVNRHREPSVAIIAAAPGIAGDVIDPVVIAELCSRDNPQGAQRVKDAAAALLDAYRALQP